MGNMTFSQNEDPVADVLKRAADAGLADVVVVGVLPNGNYALFSSLKPVDAVDALESVASQAADQVGL